MDKPGATTRASEPITRPRRFPAGIVAVREGEVGELFHLIVAGSAEVSVQGKPPPPLGPGDCGEIALLRGIPRTACC